MPEQTSSNRRPIIILVAVLVAVIAASLLVVFLRPDSSSPLTTSPAETTPDQAQTTATESFNLGVLQRTDYNALNVGLIESKQLPVQPLPGSGKANPFL